MNCCLLEFLKVRTMKFKKIQFNIGAVFIIVGLVLLLIFSFWFYNINPEDNLWLFPILSGLISGLIIMIIQIFFSWSEFQQMERIKELGVRKILPTREGKPFYASLIRNAATRIDLMGYSAKLFMEDFGRQMQDNNALLQALSNNVRVRILVYNPKNMKDNHDAIKAKKYLEKVKDRFPNFECRYYDHNPAHSIVTIDDESLIGPYFPDVASKDSPCIQISTESPFVRKYLEYFDREWDKATNV